MDSVVVAGNRPGPNVHSFADFRIAQISQMIGLGSLAQTNFLGLNEISHLGSFADFTPGPEPGIRANGGMFLQLGFVDHTAWQNFDSIADRRVADDAVCLNTAV